MKLFGFLQPRDSLSNQEVSAGLRWLTLEGMGSMSFNSITTSGILAAFALALGANNLQIGILAAIPFLMQVFQIAGIWLVEKLRLRKGIAVLTSFFAQLMWLPAALIPFYVVTPGTIAVSLLLIFLGINGFLRAFVNTCWNSWLRDLIPQQIMGRFFSRRLALTAIVSVIFSLGAAFFIDFWSSSRSGQTVYGYSFVILFGALFLAMASPFFMSLMPEPRMHEIQRQDYSIFKKLAAPLKDSNFKRLTWFLFAWSVISNLAIPFFTIYMLQRLGLPLSWVIGLSILSQGANIMFLRVWGTLVDKFGNKVILSLCTSLYLLVILGWIFTSIPASHVITIPLLAVLHIFAGIATSGIALTASTIGLKMAPREESTSYLAGTSLATNLGAGLGPLFGGLLADFFSTRHLSLDLTWTSQINTFKLPVFTFTGLDFLFAIAFILGIISLNMLSAINEKGEVPREEVLESLMTQAREFSRPMSSGMSFNLLSYFPVISLKSVKLVGLDVAMGVTIYELANAAGIAARATIKGQNILKKIWATLEKFLEGVWRSSQIIMESDEVLIARSAAYQAIRKHYDKNQYMQQVESAVMLSVVKALSHAGAMPESALLGASQGVIRAAVEANIDLELAVSQILKVAETAARSINLSKHQAVRQATLGIKFAAEDLGIDLNDIIKKYLN